MSPQKSQGESPRGPQESHSPEITVQLSDSLRRKAEEMAISEGVSFEDFILYAIAEKIARSEPPDKG